MTTTRDLCHTLGAALQVPGVERYAARLLRDGYLPRAGDEVDEADAAPTFAPPADSVDSARGGAVASSWCRLR